MTHLDAVIADYTARLLATAASLDDPAEPSLCEGWTRGHVLTHLARNADGMADIIRGARQDRNVPMYASQTVRDADIEAGATRSREDLLEDLRASADTLADQLPLIGPDLSDREFERTPGGRRVPIGRLPFMRLREVVFHHVDLDAGFGFDDLSDDLLDLFLTDAVSRLATTTPPLPPFRLETDDGDTWTVGGPGPGSGEQVGTSETVVRGSRHGILLWLARRDPRDVRTEGALPELPHGG